MKRLSITFKLFLGFLALLILALLFLGTLSTLWFIRQQSSALDEFLHAEVQSVTNRLEGIVEGLSFDGRADEALVRQTLRQDLRTFLSQRLNRPAPYKTTLLILDDRQKVLAASNAALDLLSPPVPIGGGLRIEDIHNQGPPFRMITASFPLGNGSHGTFRLACLLSSLDGPLVSYLTSLTFILGGSLLLLSFLGAGLIGLTLRPVRDMTLAAAQIGEQNLGARIPLPPGRDELFRLASTLNGLLSRLESDYAFQERLVEDLTHQLKTPLTILRGRNELGLTTRKEVEELRELVEDNLSDIDGLVNLLNTLLELARLDGRIDKLKTVPIDLSDLVTSLRDELEPLWLSKDLHLELSGEPITVEADPEALRQLFTNLLDNAWKYAPEGGRIAVTWAAREREVSIVVANSGRPIPEDDLERIFRRFYRSEVDDQVVHGSGLGLSIVRSLAELHGGRVRAFNPTEGGAAFEIVLPYATLQG